MSFLPFTEKKEKQIGICSILGRIRSRDPDPRQNEVDPKHWTIDVLYRVLYRLLQCCGSGSGSFRRIRIRIRIVKWEKWIRNGSG